MRYNCQSKIKLECSNWHKDDSQEVLYIHLKNGQQIVLNSHYKAIWENIGYGITMSDLVQKVSNSISVNLLEKLLTNLIDMKLIRIVSTEDEFDTLFN